MNRTLLGLFPLLVGAVGAVLALAPLGCASVTEDEGVDTSEGELRALGAQEIVGDIAYGTTAMEIEHPGEATSRRTYVALRFQASAGDEIETTAIAGNAADPVLYVLGSNFQTLGSNDDRAPGDKTPFITRKITRAGTYYLAMRTKEGWRTKFYVSLRRKGDAPPPPPPVASWKTAFVGHELWGARFPDLLPNGGFSGGRLPLACRISPLQSTITCAPRDFFYNGASATIKDDGTFDISTGTPGQPGNELKGRVSADGKVTVTRFRHTECFQTSSSWCEGRETDGLGVEPTVAAFELCRTPDQHFQSGGWSSGYYLACAECNGRCEGGR